MIKTTTNTLITIATVLLLSSTAYADEPTSQLPTTNADPSTEVVSMPPVVNKNTTNTQINNKSKNDMKNEPQKDTDNTTISEKIKNLLNKDKNKK